MPLPESIANARQKRGLTQNELAEKLSVHRLTVARWEQGCVRPSLPHVMQLAEILKVSPSKLLK